MQSSARCLQSRRQKQAVLQGSSTAQPTYLYWSPCQASATQAPRRGHQLTPWKVELLSPLPSLTAAAPPAASSAAGVLAAASAFAAERDGGSKTCCAWACWASWSAEAAAASPPPSAAAAAAEGGGGYWLQRKLVGAPGPLHREGTQASRQHSTQFQMPHQSDPNAHKVSHQPSCSCFKASKFDKHSASLDPAAPCLLAPAPPPPDAQHCFVIGMTGICFTLKVSHMVHLAAAPHLQGSTGRDRAGAE